MRRYTSNTNQNGDKTSKEDSVIWSKYNIAAVYLYAYQRENPLDTRSFTAIMSQSKIERNSANSVTIYAVYTVYSCIPGTVYTDAVLLLTNKKLEIRRTHQNVFISSMIFL